VLENSTLQRTPLFEVHRALGAKLVPFAGWEMPVQYTSILEEHQAVRTKAGVFDISHMGQLEVSGPGAARWLNSVLTNNAETLSPGQAHYTFLLNEAGGVIDDLFLYRIDVERFLLVVNASKAEEDLQALRSTLVPDAELVDLRATHAALAVQGPEAVALFSPLFPESRSLPDRNGVITFFESAHEVVAARTGYTGEDGFEIFFAAELAETFWQRIMNAGVTPCGLGCRDTLRLEVCYPLNGNDLSPERTPLEAGLGWAVDLSKAPFPGRDVLIKQKETGVPSKLAAFTMIDSGPPPRAHYPVYFKGNQVGEVCSGTLSPSLRIGIGMAYLPLAASAPGTEIEIDIRGKRFRAKTAKKPLYKK
jgi:aminomethyltransferase